jgi:hypothetical protein
VDVSAYRRAVIQTLVHAVFIAFVLMGSRADAQEKVEGDHSAVLEIGGAGDWPLVAGTSSLGGALGVEVTPIEHWLEIEAGASAFGTNDRREIETDLVFKKPFQLAPAVEFMAGVGPELSWNFNGPRHARSLATEIGLDFMIWPTKNIGWYVEPSYSVTGFGSKNDRSAGVTAGLLIGVPWDRGGRNRP